MQSHAHWSMCTDMHAWNHAHAHTHTHTACMHAWNHYYARAHTRAWFHACILVHMLQCACDCVCVRVCMHACVHVCMHVWEQKIVLTVVWFATLYKICNGHQISIKEYIIIILFVVVIIIVVCTAGFQKMSHEKKSQNAVRYLHSCLISQHPRVRGQTPAEVSHIWSGLDPPRLSGLHRPFSRLSQSSHIRSSSPPV